MDDTEDAVWTTATPLHARVDDLAAVALKKPSTSPQREVLLILPPSISLPDTSRSSSSRFDMWATREPWRTCGRPRAALVVADGIKRNKDVTVVKGGCTEAGRAEGATRGTEDE